MKHLFRFFLWLAGVALFLLATAHFTLRHALNTPKFKAAATRYVERTTGRSADYERIDYTLFPFSLVVRNATLKEPGGSRDFASMKSFSMVVDWRSKELTSLILTEPAIRIVQHPDGTFNFSDLLPSSATEETPPPPAAPPPAGRPPIAPSTGTPPAAVPLSIRLVQIERARLDFIQMDEPEGETSFTLSNLDFTLHDYAPDLPLRLRGSASIGNRSSVAFDASGPPLAAHAGKLGAWPVELSARLDLLDFGDVKAFLPEDTLPFQRLSAALTLQGAISEGMQMRLTLQTPEATETHSASLTATLQAELSVPAPVWEHVLTGSPLAEEWTVEPLPCEPPPGTMTLTGSPAALLLRHLQSTLEISLPQATYGLHRFTDGTATAHLRNGVLTVPAARLTAYGGTVEARGNAQLLACPLTYRLDRLSAQSLAIGQILAANHLAAPGDLSGTLHLDGRLSGQAVAEPALRSLEADAAVRIDNLQSVGTGGSLMDQAWRQLDHPLLLRLLPRLKPKVEQARRSSDSVTTSRYEEAAATLSLRNGTATLAEARLAMPGYRLLLSGTLLPFDDRLDLAARLIASPEETARLTDGKDRSAYLPYEDGGLMIPLTLRGPLQRPTVLPDLDLLLQNALAGGAVAEELAPHLETLSDSDKKHVEEGLQILQGLGTLLKK
ncbi:MAG: hypothetical protein GX548_12405 [Lentisphaerae bacterium]|nr:hypothetical protein [Lentisphaerota bacterium]